MSSPGKFFGLTRTDWLGVWLAVLTLVVGYSLIAVWPAYTNDPAQTDLSAEVAATDTSGVAAPADSCTDTATIEVEMFGQKWCADPEAGTLFGVMLLGALGSLVYVLRSYVHHRGMGTFAMGWTWWYILRALSGAGLAVIVYLALRGGLLATSASASELNKFGLGGAAALSGLFANDAIELLSRQFSTLLGSGSPSGDGGGGGGRENPDESPHKEQPHADGS